MGDNKGQYGTIREPSKRFEETSQFEFRFDVSSVGSLVRALLGNQLTETARKLVSYSLRSPGAMENAVACNSSGSCLNDYGGCVSRMLRIYSQSRLCKDFLCMDWGAGATMPGLDASRCC